MGRYVSPIWRGLRTRRGFQWVPAYAVGLSMCWSGEYVGVRCSKELGLVSGGIRFCLAEFSFEKALVMRIWRRVMSTLILVILKSKRLPCSNNNNNEVYISRILQCMRNA